MQGSTPTWAGASAWRFDKAKLNLISEFAYQVNIIGVMNGTEIALERTKKVQHNSLYP